MRENHQNSAARFVFFFTVFHRSKDRKDLIWSNFLFVRLWVCLLLSFLFFLFPLQSFERFQSKRISFFFFILFDMMFWKKSHFRWRERKKFFLLFLLNRKRKSLFAFISQCIYTNERFALRRDFCLFIYFTLLRRKQQAMSERGCGENVLVSEWSSEKRAKRAHVLVNVKVDARCD